MKTDKKRISSVIMLPILSGLLLGFSFPPSPFYSLAYIAFIPFLFIFAETDSYLRLSFFSYVFIFIFHLITLYWVGGYVVGKDIWMMVAGSALIIIHPLFYIPMILIALLMRKKIGVFGGMIALAFFWVSFEYLHSLGEYSFPWLTLANSQAYDLNRIQIIEYISIYGLSLLILLFNVFTFMLIWIIAKQSLQQNLKRAIRIFILMLIIFFGTAIYGRYAFKKEQKISSDKLRVGIIQPNFDPWEKWDQKLNRWNSYDFQFKTYMNYSKFIKEQNPELIIWPETAIPFHILLPRYSTYLFELLQFVDSIQIPILTGVPTSEYFDINNAPVTAQKIEGTDLYFESYNSIMFIKSKNKIEDIYRKTILVPFAERIPYAEQFRFLIEPLKWNVGISSWGKGNDTIVWNLNTKNGKQHKFAGMICYESVYPDYVREFVKKGAEFLIVITNDSWWGNTSGAYQHAAMASLRAVETRRYIVQCSNGGISMFVDPTGRQYSATKLYTIATFVDEIGTRSDKTFYIKYGNIFGIVCVIISLFFIIYVFSIKKKI